MTCKYEVLALNRDLKWKTNDAQAHILQDLQGKEHRAILGFTIHCNTSKLHVVDVLWIPRCSRTHFRALHQRCRLDHRGVLPHNSPSFWHPQYQGMWSLSIMHSDWKSSQSQWSWEHILTMILWVCRGSILSLHRFVISGSWWII